MYKALSAGSSDPHDIDIDTTIGYKIKKKPLTPDRDRPVPDHIGTLSHPLSTGAY
jgi:hypothetical protein